MRTEPVAEHILKTRLKQGLQHSKSRLPEVYDLIYQLLDFGSVALFGGALRDWALGGPECEPRDLDLVIHSPHEDKFDAMLSRFKPKRNNFGGYRIELSTVPLDLWLLKNTYALRDTDVTFLCLEKLRWTTFFNTDAVLMELGSGEIHMDPGFYLAFKDRLLTIVHGQNPNDIGCLVRAIRLSELYKLQISPRLLKFMRDVAISSQPKDVMQVAEGIWRQPVQMSEVLCEIVECARQNPTAPLFLHSKVSPKAATPARSLLPSTTASPDATCCLPDR